MILHSEACERNKDPILEVLRRYLPEGSAVLEIAAGSGQHAVWFARHLPGVKWQPTDASPAAVDSIRARREEVFDTGLAEPFHLDVLEPLPSGLPVVDAVVNINMIHISPPAACAGLLQKAAALVREGGLLIFYGPFFFRNQDPAPSNLAFDRSLQERNPSWGIRTYEEIRQQARDHGFLPEEVISMPANNFCCIFRKASGH